MNPFYLAVAERAANRCEYCHAPKIIFNSVFEVEHILSQHEGGATAMHNFALSCRSCNGHKSYKHFALDPQSQQTVRLFHPRTDDWDEHFEVNDETNEILGKTPTGRATVQKLQMNSDDQLQARALWRELKYFP